MIDKKYDVPIDYKNYKNGRIFSFEISIVLLDRFILIICLHKWLFSLALLGGYFLI